MRQACDPVVEKNKNLQPRSGSVIGAVLTVDLLLRNWTLKAVWTRPYFDVGPFSSLGEHGVPKDGPIANTPIRECSSMKDASSNEADRERRWAEGLRAGDRSVFEEIFRALYPDLRAYAEGIVQRSDLAEEVVQDVFLQIWLRQDEWEASDRVTAYAYRSVHNRALNVKRQQQTRREGEDRLTHLRGETDAYVLPDEQLHNSEQMEALRETIRELPERRRHIFVLSRWHDLTYAEIGEVLDISVRTVETQIRRALRALRKCIAQDE